ncbi:MAG: TIGR03790 family protein [Candidatus Solibacter usitatus]|nr:TIGR03790 family protein [Candidatus Solibacter usitatus]
MKLLAVLALHALSIAKAQGPENVLIVANAASPVSKSITEYYALKRRIPAAQVCYVNTPPREYIAREVYNRFAAAVALCLSQGDLRERILYIVTTLGVPLGIQGELIGQTNTPAAAVDSELALLYADMRSRRSNFHGPAANPFYQKRGAKFRHPDFPIYLVARLAGYDFAGVRSMIDRSLIARNTGKAIVDLQSGGDPFGDEWLRDAGIRLPADRVVFEDTSKVVYDQRNVIAYASWGSNDKNRQRRLLGFQWLPGAVATEYVSTNARTFQRPPASWTYSSWSAADQPKWFHGSPQSLIADTLQEGASAATGHVYEPFLVHCPRPEILLPAYLSGRNLAESFYLSIPSLSWMNIVVGDPLMRLAPPNAK